MKKFLSILLAVLMLAVMLPVTAMAADGYVTVTITYNGEFSIAKADAVTAAEATINGQQYSRLRLLRMHLLHSLQIMLHYLPGMMTRQKP